MFDIFTRLSAGEARPPWEQLPSASDRRFWHARRTAGRAAARRAGRPAPGRRSRRSRGGLRRVLVFCPLLTVLAVLGLLVGLSPDLVPASCRAPASATAPAAQVHASYCQKMLPAK